MKKIVIALVFIFTILSSIFAQNSYGSTSTYSFQINPEYKFNDNMSYLNVNTAITTNLNFGYKQNLGLLLQLGIGFKSYKFLNKKSYKNTGINYDISVALSYMSKYKKNNKLYTLFAIGGNLSKVAETTNFLDVDIGICLYTDIEYKINDTMFLSTGLKYTYNFMNYRQNGKNYQLKFGNEQKINAYIGVGIDINR